MIQVDQIFINFKHLENQSKLESNSVENLLQLFCVT